MLSVSLPKKIEYQAGEQPNHGNIVIEPCFPGYGITLGNSIRRVLLSSLSGAAVVGVKISGASHEFMTLPHLKEDILEFCMNLKKLRLKVFSEEVVKLELEVHGKKEIKAGDIKKNSEVEIANPELVIGNIVDMSGSLKAEIFVKRGMGYEVIENRESREKEAGYIEIDSMFSPVISVGINVGNVRVGKLTNYDRLVLDIKTDGTITPEEAFKKAVEILIEQFNALLREPEEIEVAPATTKEAEVELVSISEDSEISEEPTAEAGEDEPKKRRGRPKKAE